MKKFLPSSRVLCPAVRLAQLLSLLFLCSPGFAAPPSDEAVLTEAHLDDWAKVAALVQQGANPNATDTPCSNGQAVHLIHHVAMRGTVELMELLLAKGALIEQKDDAGSTPVLAASRRADSEMLRFLLGKHADPTAADNDQQTALHVAVYKGNLATLQLLLKSGANPNAQDANGNTPLHLAPFRTDGERIEVVKALLAKKASLTIANREGDLPLHKAIIHDNLPVFTALDQRAEEINQLDLARAGLPEKLSSLQLAVKYAAPAFLSALLALKLDPNLATAQGTALHLAVNRDEGGCRIAAARILLGIPLNLLAVDAQGRTALHLAVSSCDSQTIGAIAAKFPPGHLDVQDLEGRTALHAAAKYGNAAAVAELLERQADPLVPDKAGQLPLDVATEPFGEPSPLPLLKEATEKTRVQRAAYWAAIKSGQTAAIKAALKAGGSANRRDDLGNSGLHYALFNGHLDLADLLLAAKADINLPNKQGETPLFFAILSEAKQHLASVNWCLVHGANIGLKNAKGQTAIELAKEFSDEQIVHALQEKAR